MCGRAVEHYAAMALMKRSPKMTPIRGWAPRGKPLVAHAPFGKWRTLTFLAALRQYRIDAPCVLDGPINGESFTA